MVFRVTPVSLKIRGGRACPANSAFPVFAQAAENALAEVVTGSEAVVLVAFMAVGLAASMVAGLEASMVDGVDEADTQDLWLVTSEP